MKIVLRGLYELAQKHGTPPLVTSLIRFLPFLKEKTLFWRDTKKTWTATSAGKVFRALLLH